MAVLEQRCSTVCSRVSLRRAGRERLAFGMEMGGRAPLAGLPDGANKNTGH